MPVKNEYQIRKNWKFSDTYGSIGDPEKPDDPQKYKTAIKFRNSRIFLPLHQSINGKSIQLKLLKNNL